MLIVKAVLWLAWLAVGLVTLLEGDVSRTSYVCAWIMALVYMLLDILTR